MRTRLRQLVLLTTTVAGVGLVVTATPAAACTGDPCDSVCFTYAALPPAVQNKVFHSTSCPVR